ncbi:MAG TPA: O-methyltransferase [Candidatus Binatia bacterium]
MKNLPRPLRLALAVILTSAGTALHPLGNPRVITASQAREEPSRVAAEQEKIRSVLDGMGRGWRYLSVSRTDGEYLRNLTDSIRAKRVVEIGTSTGYSGLWFALALRATGGKLYTHEIDPGRIAMAREHFRMAGVDDIVIVVEGDAHETVKQHREPIDLLFLDADKEGYIDYLRKLLPLVRPGGLIVAHNMRRPRPDPRYMEAITTNPDLETRFVLMEGAGIGVTKKLR